ncbi:MAG: hypothetical protein KAG34_07590 [Cocleimonas sp.]|nr:hypothetical protein [Cocleimonas sp.]
MPLLSIETNQSLHEALNKSEVLNSISKAVAELLSKPESYVMIKYNYNPSMLFAGTNAPLAYLEFKSLGLPEENTAQFSSALAEILEEELNIEAGRLYIEFSNPNRHMWGWNSGTF